MRHYTILSLFAAVRIAIGIISTGLNSQKALSVFSYRVLALVSPERNGASQHFCMTLDEAIEQQRTALKLFLEHSEPADGLAGDPLPEINDRRVVVRRAPTELFESTIDVASTEQESDSTVMLDEHSDEYVIFLRDPPRSSPNGLYGEEVERYYAWHEYAHIEYGHVFFDDPKAVYDGMTNGSIQAQERDVEIHGRIQYLEERGTQGG